MVYHHSRRYIVGIHTLPPHYTLTPFPTHTQPNDSNVKDIFGRIAPVYDELNFWLSWGQHGVWKQMTVDWSLAKSGNLCLDLCCGSGDLSFLLAEAVGRKGKVVGVDFAAPQLEKAVERARLYYPSFHFDWIEADVLSLPFPSEHFDGATMGYGLRNVSNIPKSLTELWRVLKPGATAAILDMHRAINPYVYGLQQWYLDNVVVPVAHQFNVAAEYSYIAPSLERFPQGKEQVSLAKQVGFHRAVHYSMAGGTMGVLVLGK